VNATEQATANALARAQARLDLAELMARYARAVDALAFDQLAAIFTPDVQVRYSWQPFGADQYETRALDGLAQAQTWLRDRLTGRTELRRFMSGLRILEHGPDHALGSVQMHERGMRISGTYGFEAVRRERGWRLRRLDLVEEILWV